MAKVKELKEEVKDESKALLGSILKEHKEDHYNFEERILWKCSTGSLLLDMATGGVSPGLWRLCGNNNSGKTPQTLEIVRNFLETVPNSKALWVLAEGRFSDENKDRCGLKFTTDPEDWEVGTVFILESHIFETVIKVIRDLVKNNPSKNKYAFVIDSVDGLTLKDDSLKEITESNKVAGVPALSKKMLQNLSLGMFKFGHWMGLISQVTAEIKIDPYAKTPNRGGNFSGGNALLHGADFILNYEASYNGDYILDNPSGKLNDGKTKPIGLNVKVLLAKSAKEETKKTTITYPVKYGRKPSGIWLEREVGDLVMAWGLAKRNGAWIKFNDNIISELRSKNIEVPDQIQGFDNFYKYFEENTEAINFFVKEFKKRLT